MKMTLVASYSAAPSRLMLVPSGITNLTRLSRQPYLVAHSIVIGMVAAEEDVPKPMAKAGTKTLVHGHMSESYVPPQCRLSMSEVSMRSRMTWVCRLSQMCLQSLCNVRRAHNQKQLSSQCQSSSCL